MFENKFIEYDLLVFSTTVMDNCSFTINEKDKRDFEMSLININEQYKVLLNKEF